MVLRGDRSRSNPDSGGLRLADGRPDEARLAETCITGEEYGPASAVGRCGDVPVKALEHVVPADDDRALNRSHHAHECECTFANRRRIGRSTDGPSLTP